MENYSAWIGKSETISDYLSPVPLKGLSALLDYEAIPWPENKTFPLAHWFHFLPQARQSQIDVDGHPKRGGFLPPVALPRRMWAGGRLEFKAPLTVAAPLEKCSSIANIQNKTGGTGELVFVTVRHEITSAGELAVIEEQDLVYRGEAGKTTQPKPSTGKVKKEAPATDAPVADECRTVTPDPVQLFRFSALTFNSHRIHYDRDYARDVEGYAGLVVHGPFIATLLLDHFQRCAPDKSITSFSFRAQRPLLDTDPFDVCLSWTDTGANLWSRNSKGEATMTATLEAE